MPTNDERREAARKLRERYGERSIDFVGQGMMGQLETLVQDIRDCIPKGRTLLVLADLIDPDIIPDNPDETGRPLSKPIERWTSFDDRLPDPGTPVLCRSKNGVFYVGKPVTANGKRTRMVWVPRGGQYRAPDMWRPIEVPAGSVEIDRDALLAPADDLTRMSTANGAILEGEAKTIARKIREAVGDDA